MIGHLANCYIIYPRKKNVNHKITFRKEESLSMSKKSLFKVLLASLTLLYMVFCLTGCNPHKGQLQIHVIDVGQGDSTLVVTPDDKNILIDGGEDEYSRNVIRHLKRSHIRRLDAVIGTHFDSDHIGGLDKVIEEFPTNKV